MKKTLLVILTVLLLFTAACSDSGKVQLISDKYPQDNTFHPEYDCPYYLETTYADNQIAETENGCYILKDDHLLYMDFDTLVPIPVCAKPECRHDAETDPEKRKQCNAYFQRILLFGGVYYNNDQLYVLHSLFGEKEGTKKLTGSSEKTSYQLTRLSTDGTTRKTACIIEFPFGSGTIGYSCIHRGTFYCVQQMYNENGMALAEIWAYSLDNQRKEPQQIYTSELKDTRSNIIQNLYAFGNYLYWQEFVMNESTGVAESRNFVLDLVTAESSEILPPEGNRCGNNFIVNGSLFSYYSPLDSSGQITESGAVIVDAYLHKSDLTGNDAIGLGNYPCSIATADEQYIYMGEPIIGKPTAEQKLSIYDHELNLIDTISYEGLYAPETKYAECDFFPLSGEKIILKTFEKGISTYYCFDRTEIGTGNIIPQPFLQYSEESTVYFE